MHRNIILTVLLVALILSSTFVWGKPAEGDDAPNIRYQDLDENDVWLHEEYEDMIVVLELFGVD